MDIYYTCVLPASKINKDAPMISISWTRNSVCLPLGALPHISEMRLLRLVRFPAVGKNMLTWDRRLALVVAEVGNMWART